MARITFLGTKGEIAESPTRHKYHSSLLVKLNGFKLLIDYGELRKHSLQEIAPAALCITHAHPDHYAWLHEDVETDLPVYLTRETLDYGKYRPANPVVVQLGRRFELGPITGYAYRVLHSIRCPAVGFKLTLDGKMLVYNPDVVDIVDKDGVLTGVDYYVGDGSSVRANLVRRKGDALFGHARITTQMHWCEKHGIPHVYFTHLGKETIQREPEFEKGYGDAILAWDGMEVEIT
ncbi:MAG: MBL fold metallo-hydrolase [Chloroflexota bacterium]